jgi:BirA family transcriptional regulator, biotin operon repressor / biotin---[acetyl-CoA-carboxylase] ligase
VSVSSRVFPLLRLLADGEFHTGAALAAAMGVPASSMRSHMDTVERLSVPVQRVPGRGYRLGDSLDLLDPEQLHGTLQRAYAIEVVDECPSTNGVLMDRARNGAGHGLVLACEYQTAGRGRRGKHWRSGIGTDLTFSVLWEFPKGAATLSGLSLAVGVALVRALGNLGYGGVQLKWPNDLMLRGRKLGGILIEVAGRHGGPAAAVIGVGLNVRWNQGRDALVEQPATGLPEGAGSARTRTALLAGLLLEMHAALALFGRSGFAPFRNEWLEHHVWQGRRVTLRGADGDASQSVAEGEAVGVAEDGALLLRSRHGIRRFHSGELRLAL